MTAAIIRVLLIEDEEGDAYLVKSSLKLSDKNHFEITWVESLALAKEALETTNFDVILLDLSLPDSNGLQTVEAIQYIAMDTPIIILTGHADTDFALTALKTGVSDYMVKGDFGFNGLGRAIHYSLLRVEMETHNKLLVSALNAAGNAIIITDKDTNIKWANPAFSRLTGYSLEEAIGHNPSELLKSGVQTAQFYRTMWKRLLAGKQFRCELINKRKNGELYHEELTIASVKNSRGEITNFIGIKENISKRKGTEQMLHKLASTDSLTGLFNRRVFLERLTQESERISRLGGVAALLMLDLDFFKHINDTYGHSVGDDVLKKFAEVLQKNSRAIDVPARLGGEEFALLLPSTGREEAMAVAERLRKQVSEIEMDHPKGMVRITVSIGVAALCEGDTTSKTVFNYADSAMYTAKHSGRNQTCWFEI